MKAKTKSTRPPRIGAAGRKTAVGELGGIKAIIRAIDANPLQVTGRHCRCHRRLPHHRHLHFTSSTIPALQPSVAADAIKALHAIFVVQPPPTAAAAGFGGAKQAEYDARLEKAIRHEADVKHALLHTHGGECPRFHHLHHPHLHYLLLHFLLHHHLHLLASGIDAIEHIVGAMWRAKGDENLTSIVTEGKKALAAIIGKDTELKTIAVNAGAEDGWLPADA